MIVGLPNTQQEYVAAQAIAHIQRKDGTLSRAVLEAMLRELLEHWTMRAWLDSDHSLEERRVAIEKGLGGELEGRGVALRRLDFRPLPQHSSQNPHDCQADWSEILLDDIVTQDGFTLALDIVVRTWVHQAVFEQEGPLAAWKSTLRIALEREVRNLCKDRDLEDLLSHRSQWAAEALRCMTEGEVDVALDQMHLEYVRAGHQAGLDSLWVTDIKVKARQDAFQPKAKPRYGDPFEHFFFQAYGVVIREPQREDSDR